jgi:hypothetical protein
VIAAAKDATERRALLPHVIAVADALAYAHSEGVIHRDLKPGNVLIGSFGETVVIDWGLAKDLRAADGDPSAERPGPGAGARPAPEPATDASDTSPLTVAGAVMGTPAFMSPEQARGEPADERSDVYAIGALLYAVLAGAAPIEDASATADGADGHRPIVPLAERVPDAPPELVTIVEHAMAHDPEDRFATASELADELRRYAAGQLVASHVYSTGTLVRRWLRRHRAAVAVAAAALALVAVLSAIGVARIIRERDRADRESALAKEALRRAEDESDDLVTNQAEGMLAEDPSRTLAWLQRLTRRGLERERTHQLATAAAARGAAYELAGAGDDVEYVVVVSDGVAVTASDDGHVWKWSLAERRGVDLGAHTARSRHSRALPTDGGSRAAARNRRRRLRVEGPRRDGATRPSTPHPPAAGASLLGERRSRAHRVAVASSSAFPRSGLPFEGVATRSNLISTPSPESSTLMMPSVTVSSSANPPPWSVQI